MIEDRRPFDLAEHGACPRCRGGLAQEPVGYRCRGCGALWPIVEGVPRFVDSEHYVGSFGFQWRRHRKTQLDSSESRQSEETFVAKTGLRPEDVRGKLVLDVGVGTARFSDVVARFGGTPVGVDLSLAVLSARRNLAPYYPAAFVAQADLFKLPFKEESFDHVFSIGVLHHTPSTRDAFRSIARYLKPGGTLTVGLYEEHPTYYRYSTRYRRYTSAMSHSLLHLLSHAAIAHWHVVDALRLAFGPFGPFVAGQFQTAYPMRDHKDPRWRVLDTFDWYSPRFQWKHTEEETRAWFQELGFDEVRRLDDATMLCVRGHRPLGAALRTPPPSVEAKRGGIEPLPLWVPEGQPARDAILLGLLGGEAVRTALEVGRDVAAQTLAKARGQPSP